MCRLWSVSSLPPHLPALWACPGQPMTPAEPPSRQTFFPASLPTPSSGRSTPLQRSHWILGWLQPAWLCSTPYSPGTSGDHHHLGSPPCGSQAMHAWCLGFACKSEIAARAALTRAGMQGRPEGRPLLAATASRAAPSGLCRPNSAWRSALLEPMDFVWLLQLLQACEGQAGAAAVQHQARQLVVRLRSGRAMLSWPAIDPPGSWCALHSSLTAGVVSR